MQVNRFLKYPHFMDYYPIQMVMKEAGLHDPKSLVLITGIPEGGNLVGIARMDNCDGWAAQAKFAVEISGQSIKRAFLTKDGYKPVFIVELRSEPDVIALKMSIMASEHFLDWNIWIKDDEASYAC